MSMGIYIKGMEKPENCHKCEFVDILSTCPCNKMEYEDFWYDGSLAVGVHKDCPIISVPPHGRLIDADALADVFRGFIAMYDSCPFSQLSLPDKARRDELQSALAEVINAPTIIPASGGQEDE